MARSGPPNPFPTDQIPTDNIPWDKVPFHVQGKMAFAKPDIDVLTAAYPSQTIPVLTNDGSGNFTPSTIATSSPPTGSNLASAIKFGDFDGDGDLDAYASEGYSGQFDLILINDGTGSFSITTSPTGSADVAFGDLDGDGDLDGLVGHSVLWNDGSGNFTVEALENPNQTREVVLGDLDGDGDLDAFFGNIWSGNNQVFINDGNGGFTAHDAPGYNNGDVALGDLDGDGDLDAIITSDFSYVPNQILENDGTGQFTAVVPSIGPSHSDAVAIGDVDGDGDLDALLGNSFGSTELLVNEGAFTFDVIPLTDGNYYTRHIEMADLDADGDLDAIVFNEWEGYYDPAPSEILINDGSGNFQPSPAPGDSYASYGAALGDFDGDGTVPPVDEYGLPNINQDGLLPSMYVDMIA